MGTLFGPSEKSGEIVEVGEVRRGLRFELEDAAFKDGGFGWEWRAGLLEERDELIKRQGMFRLGFVRGLDV
jgi:hypothetical protein